MELDEQVTTDTGQMEAGPGGVENQGFSEDVDKTRDSGGEQNVAAGEDNVNSNANICDTTADSDTPRTSKPATLPIDIAERPGSLAVDIKSNYAGNGDLDASKYRDGVAMSPSYYMLTPDELSLDGSESPRSIHSDDQFHPPGSKSEPHFTFEGDLWRKDASGKSGNDPWTSPGGDKKMTEQTSGSTQAALTAVSPNTGHPLAENTNSVPVDVEINLQEPSTADEDSPKRRVIEVDSEVRKFPDSFSHNSSIDDSLDIVDAPIENGNMRNGSACIRIGDEILESSTDPDQTDGPRTSTSFQDINLTLDRDRPSVSYRSMNNSTNRDYYQTDVVTLEEIMPRVFDPAGMKSAQHLATVVPTECHGWTGANINPETMPLQLIQLEVSKEDYKRALTLLGKDVKIAYHTFFYNKWLQIGLFSLVFITLWMMGFLLWHTGGLPDRIGIGLFFILAWLFMVVGLVLCRIARNKMNKKTENTLSKVNEVLLKHNVIMGVEDKGAMSCNKVILHFIYFEEGPCMERLMDDIAKGLQKNRKIPKSTKKQRRDASPEVDIDESDLIIDERDSTEGHRQILAKQLLLKYSGKGLRPHPSEEHE